MDLKFNSHMGEDLELKVALVVDEVQAIRQIDTFRLEGYALDEIYVLTYDQRMTSEITDMTDANRVSLSEEGVSSAIANLFRSKEGRLRARMEALGLSKMEAKRYEEDLDEGGYLIIARPKSLDDIHHRDDSTHDMHIPPTGFR